MEFSAQINIAQSIYSIEIYGNINTNSNSVSVLICIVFSVYMVIHITWH